MKTSAKLSIFVILIFFMLAVHAQAVRLKIATLSPDGSMWMEQMRLGAEEVAEKTDKRVKIKYYPGGVMGDDKAVLKKIRVGQLHGGALVSGSLSKIYPDNQVYSMPMKFKSFEEIDFVRKKMDAMISEGLEKKGFVTLGIAEGGFAYVMSNNEVHSVDDLAKQKVWVPDNDPIILEGVKAFDVTPIPLSIADVRTGLQTGLINTVATPLIGAVALQWHTQVKYVLDVPILYIYGVLIVNKKAFSKISVDDQKIVREVMGKAFHEIDVRTRKDNVSAMGVLKKQGIKFIKPEPAIMKTWNEKADSACKRVVANGNMSGNLLKFLDKMIEEYRSEQPG